VLSDEEPGTTAWFALFGPANMAPELVAKIHADVAKVLELPQSREFFHVNSFERVDLTPYDLQRQFVGDLRARGLMEGESQRGHFTPFLIPIGGPLRTTAAGRVLLAGDAGGFVNGFSAEGIYYAMVTGDLAARAILAARRRDVVDPAAARRGYVRLWKREIGAELRDSVLIQKYLFPNPARMDRVVRAARTRPEFPRILVDYASGRLSYGAARRRMLWHFPRLLPRLAWVALRGRPSTAAGGTAPAGMEPGQI